MLRRYIPLVLFSMPLPVAAHELWLDREGTSYILFQGHRHSHHASAEVVPYDPAAVKSAVCVGRNGAARALPLSTSYPARFSGECAAALVSFSTGYWTKTAWETRNVPKSGIAGALKSWLAEDSVKRIDLWTAASAQPISNGLEITPVSDPTRIDPDGKLVVLVTENGKPKAGVAVSHHGDKRGTTGDDGRIVIRIRHRGAQLISASVAGPLDDGKADTVIRTTVLQFEAAK